MSDICVIYMHNNVKVANCRFEVFFTWYDYAVKSSNVKSDTLPFNPFKRKLTFPWGYVVIDFRSIKRIFCNAQNVILVVCTQNTYFTCFLSRLGLANCLFLMLGQFLLICEVSFLSAVVSNWIDLPLCIRLFSGFLALEGLFLASKSHNFF